MRDVQSEAAERNGRRPVSEDPEAPSLLPGPWTPELERQLQTARVDSQLAGVAGLIYDATQKIEPLAHMLSVLLARWVVSGIGAGLCFYAGTHGDPWQRLAAAAAFFVGCKLIWWRSR